METYEYMLKTKVSKIEEYIYGYDDDVLEENRRAIDAKLYNRNC